MHLSLFLKTHLISLISTVRKCHLTWLSAFSKLPFLSLFVFTCLYLLAKFIFFKLCLQTTQISSSKIILTLQEIFCISIYSSYPIFLWTSDNTVTGLLLADFLKLSTILIPHRWEELHNLMVTTAMPIPHLHIYNKIFPFG